MADNEPSSSSSKRKLEDDSENEENSKTKMIKSSDESDAVIGMPPPQQQEASSKKEWPTDETDYTPMVGPAMDETVQKDTQEIPSVSNDAKVVAADGEAEVAVEAAAPPHQNEVHSVTADSEAATTTPHHASGLIVEASQQHEADIISGQSDGSAVSIPKKSSTIGPATSVDPTTMSSDETPTQFPNHQRTVTTTITTTTVMPTTTATPNNNNGGGAMTKVPDPTDFVEEKASLLPEYVGRVIGKGGEMIRDLQARSGCKIDVDQNVPHGAPRVISYQGMKQKVEFAKHLVYLLSEQNVGEDDLPLGEAKEEVLAVPATVVGKVIGRGGEMIRELQAKSHAKIQVDHSNRHGLAPDQKRVSITGNAESVAKAKEMVLFLTTNPLMEAQQALSMLIHEKSRAGGQWGSGPPYHNLPNQGVNMHPQSAGGPPPAAANPFGGYGGPPPGAMYPPQQQQHQQSMYPPQQQHHQQQQFFSAGHELIYVQKQYMGRIIGGKGVTINDLQKRSNCSIQINQNVPHGQDCEVTITGNPQGVESAKQMIQEIIQAGPSHPYAGGAPPQQQYGGGPAAYGQGMYGGGGGYSAGGMPQQQMQQAYVPPQQQMYPAYDQRQQQAPQQPYGYGAAVAPVQQYGGYVQQQPQAQAAYGYAAPVAAPAQSPWKSATAADGQVYYYNEQTGQTQWEKPPGMP